jgi:SAM-dependent methyltransferase
MKSVALKYSHLCDDPDESHMQVLDLIPRGSRVLEIGASVGYLSLAIAERACKVVAVEQDLSAVAVARARGIEMRAGRFEDLNLSEEYGTFDCLVLADVLEHIVDAGRFLQLGVRCLRPGGIVVLSVPNIAHWSTRWSLLRGRFEYTSTGLLDETHVRFYTAGSLERLLAGHGLTIVERRASLGLACYPCWKSIELQWNQRRIVRKVARRLPQLFAYQFIWVAHLNDHAGADRQARQPSDVI